MEAKREETGGNGKETVGKKDKSKHQLKIKFVFLSQSVKTKNKQIIFCMPLGYNEFEKKQTKEIGTIPPSLTQTHFPAIVLCLIFLFLQYEQLWTWISLILKLSRTHAQVLTLKAPIQFPAAVEEESLLVCAHATPWLFNESTKSKE